MFEGVPHAPEFTAIWCDITPSQISLAISMPVSTPSDVIREDVGMFFL